MIWFIILGVFAWFSYRFFYGTPHGQDQSLPESSRVQPKVPPIEIPKTTTRSPRDQVAGVVESLNWCNDMTRICWPQIGKIVQSQLAPTIEPLINLYLPRPFSKFRFVSADLGKKPLTVDRVTVHRRFHDSIALDVDVSFRGSPNVSMKCAPLSAAFGIKELRWSGRLSILLRPLMPTLPLVGAVQAAMITHPYIDMDFAGIANIAEFGPIEKIVRMVLRNVIASMLVLPNRFLYKLTDSVDFFKAYFPPVGVLDISIERGRGFTKDKKAGMIKTVPDLYCKATFALETMKTDVRMNDLSPEWNCTEGFILSDMEQPFELSCYDKDALTRDDLVGTMTLTAKQLLDKGAGWEKLQDKIDLKVAQNGQIFLSSKLWVFRTPTDRIQGRCLVSILVDRATNLPPQTKVVACKVTVGRDPARKTPQIIKPDEPIAGVDPVNPIWSFSFDILCEDTSKADVTLEVVEDRKVLGKTAISARELDESVTKTKEGEFQLGNGATLRAMVMLRGLVEDQEE